MSNQNEQTASPEMIGVTKMSVNSIAGKRAMGKICVILGKATGIKTGEDANGKVWEALTGTFQGHNLQTGEVFRSGKLFLPSGIHEPILEAVKGLPENGSVKFALEFRRVEAENPIGYSYQAVELMPREVEQDELADVLKLAGPRIQPVKQIAPAPEPAVEAEPVKPAATSKRKAS